MKEKVKIGMVQMEIESDIFSAEIRKKNVAKAVEMISGFLQSTSVDMIVLSDEFYAGAGYGPISLPDTINRIKTNIFGPLADVANKFNVYIVGGVVTKLDVDEFKSNNVGFVLNRDGELIGFQERFHQNPTEEPYSFKGKEYMIFDLDIGKVGLCMGMDILFPEVARKFALKGTELLVSPVLSPGIMRSVKNKSYYPNDLFVNCAVARAIENQNWVIMVNGLGKFAHVEMDIFGESLAAGPLGIIKNCGEKEGVYEVELVCNDIVEAKKSFDLESIRNQEACCIPV